MTTPHLLAPLLAQPWAIQLHRFAAWRESLRALDGTLTSLHSALTSPASPANLTLEDFFTPRAAAALDDATRTATISIHGPLADKAPLIFEKLGGTDYRTLRREIDGAITSGASAIHLLIDSPGGTVAGLRETSRAISSASAAGIPVTAHCDGLACSAAYYLASAADTITASPSAEVGNIGTVLHFADDAGFWEAQGVQFHLFTNQGADLKGTFRQSPTPEQTAFLQDRIDSLGADFRSQVEGGRPGINPEVFRAGWYSGGDALALGLVDTITD